MKIVGHGVRACLRPNMTLNTAKRDFLQPTGRQPKYVTNKMKRQQTPTNSCLSISVSTQKMWTNYKHWNICENFVPIYGRIHGAINDPHRHNFLLWCMHNTWNDDFHKHTMRLDVLMVWRWIMIFGEIFGSYSGCVLALFFINICISTHTTPYHPYHPIHIMSPKWT